MTKATEENIMKKLTLSTALLAALAVSGTAQAYQFELNGGAGYSHVSTHKVNNNTEAAGVGGSATIYLKNVDSKNAPLAEAAFINQASSVTGGYQYLQGDSSTGDAKIHGFTASGEFFVPTSLIGLGDALPLTLYAAGGAARAKHEGFGFNGFNYAAEVGLIPNQLPFDLGTLLLAAGVTGFHDNLDKELDPTIRAKLLSKLYQNDINVEAYAQLGGNNKAVLGNKYNLVGLNGDFYTDSTFSVGAGYQRLLINGQHDPFKVSVNARKFLMDNLSVQAGVDFGKGSTSVSATKGIANDDNNFGANVGATLRF